MTLEEGGAIAVAIVACIFDLYHRRIPNALTFGAALAAIVIAVLTHGVSGLTTSLSGWLLGLAIWLPIYALGGMGAGDVKLMAAIGAWLGAGDAFYAALYAGIAGGVAAVLVATAHGCLRRTWSNVQMLMLHWRVAGFTPHGQLTLDTAASPRLAYAVPILIGTLMAIWVR